MTQPHLGALYRHKRDEHIVELVRDDGDWCDYVYVVWEGRRETSRREGSTPIRCTSETFHRLYEPFKGE